LLSQHQTRFTVNLRYVGETGVSCAARANITRLESHGSKEHSLGSTEDNLVIHMPEDGCIRRTTDVQIEL